MNKKGFTLVELLAVIAILAILVIIALPNVIKLYNNAKKNTFLTEVKSLYDTANSKYISESLKGNNLKEISSNDSSKLDLNGNELTYKISLSSDGKVSTIAVKKGNYCIITDNVPAKITKDDISEDCEGFNVLANWYDECKDKNTLRCKMLSDNETYDDSVKSKYVTSSSGINFKEISSDTNGKGLYYTTDLNATDENNDGLSNRIYYYRGDINNNFVVMGDKCYKILRTTENGNVKIMYHDKVNTDGTCNEKVEYVEDTELVGGQYEQQIYYNFDFTDLTYGGYMMGDIKLKQLKLNFNAYITNALKNYKTSFSTDYKYENGEYSLSGNIITGTIKELCTKDNCKIKNYYFSNKYCDAYAGRICKIISHEKINVFNPGTGSIDELRGDSYYSDAFKYEYGKFSLSGKIMGVIDGIDSNSYCKTNTCYTVDDNDETSKRRLLYGITGETDDALVTFNLVYGTDTYKEAISNKNDSAIKKHIDVWYKNNIQDKNFSSKIADEIYCNDRSQSFPDKDAYIKYFINREKSYYSLDDAKKAGYDNLDEFLNAEGVDNYAFMKTLFEHDYDNSPLGLYYSASNRFGFLCKDCSNNKPSYKCANKNDRFTTTTLGNGKLTYPVAIITADDVIYAGGSFNKVNKNYMFADIWSFWTMTPLVYNMDMGYGIYIAAVRNDGQLDSLCPNDMELNLDVGLSRKAYPVLALKSDTEITKGNGTLTNPYVIK